MVLPREIVTEEIPASRIIPLSRGIIDIVWRKGGARLEKIRGFEAGRGNFLDADRY